MLLKFIKSYCCCNANCVEFIVLEFCWYWSSCVSCVLMTRDSITPTIFAMTFKLKWKLHPCLQNTKSKLCVISCQMILNGKVHSHRNNQKPGINGLKCELQNNIWEIFFLISTWHHFCLKSFFKFNNNLNIYQLMIASPLIHLLMGKTFSDT